MAIAGGLSPDQLLDLATNALAALKQATQGKDAERPTETTVGSLQSLMQVIDRLRDEVVSLRRIAIARDNALRRIANLEVRSAAEFIEASRWKELTAELQALAETMIAPERKRPSRDATA